MRPRKKKDLQKKKWKEHPASDLLSDPGVLWGQYMYSSRSWGVPLNIIDLIGLCLSNGVRMGDDCGDQVHPAVIPYFVLCTL